MSDLLGWMPDALRKLRVTTGEVCIGSTRIVGLIFGEMSSGYPVTRVGSESFRFSYLTEETPCP